MDTWPSDYNVGIPIMRPGFLISLWSVCREGKCLMLSAGGGGGDPSVLKI